MSTAAIIPAAGLGLRLGGETPKAFREVGGDSLLVHAVRGLKAASAADLVCLVVAVPPGSEESVVKELGPYVEGVELLVVAGGAERSDSVAAALAVVPVEGIDCVLVHDAARAFVPVDAIERVVAAVRAGAAAVVPALPVTDTIKQIGPGGEVVGTPDRSTLVAVQTPQGFDPEVLRRAHAAGVVGATDDAMLCERLGVTVVTVEGSTDAFKVTRPQDLLLAEALLAERRAV
ncbi:2-C-methyl-D-erythritol 4-phosphate cytidylyltransferase [Kribbella sandramycini]|uniref:2-C-methyl-D-erythritol 4-phosphate cytidylyltransferase n=1 Tax=Kribbella sandramycini TaxID=60450 RepID=A0A7Y4P281_9ACTN|nr:2-C-methyl-D-erythritol 4-phosphate cytidylyltransferase [Kribbella sandramycini]MBB6566483.1 2-C-methyl-D-erythritol 4-phosphate cytidylyltransferase [Kribbella sandramycini]NOL42860.1 2-C-methyl-D-erythritol 4-phosphate cytidylyltransferase [Kribbella sandramycini]